MHKFQNLNFLNNTPANDIGCSWQVALIISLVLICFYCKSHFACCGLISEEQKYYSACVMCSRNRKTEMS